MSMRLRWLVLAAVLGCKKDPPALDKPVTPTVFAKVVPVAGAKRRESSELTMALSLATDGGRANVNVRESVKRTEEILAVTGDAVTKTKVTFDSVEATQPSVVGGKTFVVESKDAKLDVRDEQGKPAPADQAKEVEKHLKNLGKPDPMLAALPTGGVLPGQKVEGVAKAIRDQLKDDGDGMVANDVVVTFKEQRGDDGVFDVALELVKDEGSSKMVIKVQGAAWVSTKTSSTTKMELTGPVSIGGGSMSKTEGSGTMTMKMESKSL